jgi:molybdopterin molybdotransferase
MISYEQALENILKNTRALSSEKVLTERSLGRVLNEDIISGIEMPAFNRSAMDGYAVNYLDIKKVPVKLKCIGLIQAGDVFTKKLKSGECVKIMTGAEVPENADTVVMVEYSRISEDGVEILKAAQKSENIFFQGEDFKKGQVVLEKGAKILPSHIGILATVGRKFVKVFGKPRVAVLNTGGEIVSLGEKLGRNKIYNSNGPMLQALLESDGITPVRLGIAKDNSKELKEKIKKGLDTDILLISGGVSMGDYDLVPDILEELGVKKIFHKVNIKPGKPVFFGTKGKTVIFGVPGNPVSNFTAYHIFIRPAIQKMMGAAEPGPGFKEGIAATDFHKKAGRRYFALAKISLNEGKCYLSSISGHSSADTLSLSRADSLVMLDDASTGVKNNSKVKFITWQKL